VVCLRLTLRRALQLQARRMNDVILAGTAMNVEIHLFQTRKLVKYRLILYYS